ncbi:hypothetical protein SAMN02745146_2299 [Hymenobacter daecheongensis DSM 21074]|uniref:WD40-like Beta Propeller Repeat n=1 Tax=Hymenobacter daecheongensis DSM 21074 TaxID=1121955 RepID=A0A1M6GKW6_9BACT|nr:hypothetical protein [Hymenobacter daecheongensis]SHJ10582.1 hypothetical protein SAMN02745146_2299 [Hymenobacter daecheongensis DSM 21074]
MRHIFASTTLLSVLVLGSCTDAQSDDKPGKGKKNKDKADDLTEELVPGLQKVGEMSKVTESSGLARANTAGTFYTHADAGNEPLLYKVDMTGRLLERSQLPFTNVDWESLAQDDKGTLFITDAGNNNSSRRDLAIYRLNPGTSETTKIRFAYADQRAFPPGKKERNFDCEASIWHAGKLYLFTKDRAQQRTSKVYTLPDQPGDQTARLLTSLSIPGEVTDASLSPNGQRLALLGREELFILDGSDLASALKATPRRFSLKGAGQTEGAVFLDDQTLMISTEEGFLYQYKIPQ